MRVAMIVVSILVVATPSEASKSCMSKTEARQHFGSVRIYWQAWPGSLLGRDIDSRAPSDCPQSSAEN
jgi:hypothetical protein